MNRDNGDFDWFKKYSDISQHLAPLIPNKDARILMLGCGNSTLSRDMYDDGYHNILNIDVNEAFRISKFYLTNSTSIHQFVLKKCEKQI